jgi:prephenate dehydrogenase
VGGHPFAGDTRAGWAASRTGLFTGKTVYLCPTPHSSPAAITLARELWTRIGGVPVELEAEEHDRRVAWTSHLPQVVSTALAQALAATGIGPGELGTGGQSATRLAGSSADVWLDILRDNRAHVVEGLAALEERIGSIRAAIDADDAEAIRTAFLAANRWHEAK